MATASPTSPPSHHPRISSISLCSSIPRNAFILSMPRNMVIDLPPFSGGRNRKLSPNIEERGSSLEMARGSSPIYLVFELSIKFYFDLGFEFSIMNLIWSFKLISLGSVSFMILFRSEENIRDHASLITIDLTQIDLDSVEVHWSKGHKPLPPLHPLLIKGRNLYRLNTLRRRWEDEPERQRVLSKKHCRGSLARSSREARIQGKIAKKMLKGAKVCPKERQHICQEKNHRLATGPISNNSFLVLMLLLRSALVTFVMSKIKEIAERDGTPLMADGKLIVVNEQQVEKFLYTALKLLRYSRMTVVVLVSLPPPPPSPIYILYGILGSFGGKHSEAFNCKRIQERCGHVVYIT
uniref:DUF7699 domain-containing protein n=1 Tax=Chenopodium quinoa TaxID=63459 RepID=A0A803N816_CHEQI